MDSKKNEGDTSTLLRKGRRAVFFRVKATKKRYCSGPPSLALRRINFDLPASTSEARRAFPPRLYRGSIILLRYPLRSALRNYGGQESYGGQVSSASWRIDFCIRPARRTFSYIILAMTYFPKVKT